MKSKIIYLFLALVFSVAVSVGCGGGGGRYSGDFGNSGDSSQEITTESQNVIPEPLLENPTSDDDYGANGNWNSPLTVECLNFDDFHFGDLLTVPILSSAEGFTRTNIGIDFDTYTVNLGDIEEFEIWTSNIKSVFVRNYVYVDNVLYKTELELRPYN